jgi:hypothetical protein
MIHVSTDVICAFRYVINKERNIQFTCTVKIQTGLTIQIEKHSKTPMKNYVKIRLQNDPIYVCISNKKKKKTQIYINCLNGCIS